MINEGMLPVWLDENNEAQYKIPDCLGCLSDCEKMLIQKLSTHVPAHHLKYGVIGVKGHVCAFPQEISEICSVLPRLPSDCSVVRYVKEVHSRVIGGTTTRLFKVRRNKVLDALCWLKKYHVGYKDITINESNMDWMQDKEEADIPATVNTIAGELEELDDIGPSPKINMNPVHESDFHVTHNGILVEDAPVLPSDEDRHIAGILENAESGKEIFLNWPSVSNKAISELTEEKIFPLAFPWLFPGGIGDIKDFRQRKLTADEWAKRLIMYEDARFATDKIFCFYVLNYCVRRRNRNSGNFFVNRFSSGCNGDVESLRDAIIEGKSNFVNEIAYFSKDVIGSDGYWRFKRNELHSWINHHVEVGNGRPSYFITLSCAEYFWPDIIRLVKERHFIATGESIDISEGIKGRTQLINDHAGVVQEYFQKRVEQWLDTVGKDVFGIKHYWVRYEFAPSRGQIHVHMLCISSDQSMQEAMYELRHDETKQAEVIAEWSERKMGLSASLPEHNEERRKQNPVTLHYSNIKYNTKDRWEDIQTLKEEVAMHDCSGYCLRESNKGDKEKYCELHNLET